MARLFGAGQVYDAFLLGFRIPESDARFVRGGRALLGVRSDLHQYLATKGKREAAELSNLVATALLSVVVGVLCVLGMIFSPQLVSRARARVRGSARQI